MMVDMDPVNPLAPTHTIRRIDKDETGPPRPKEKQKKKNKQEPQLDDEAGYSEGHDASHPDIDDYV